MVMISEGIERCPALIDLALTVAIVGAPRTRRVQKKMAGNSVLRPFSFERRRWLFHRHLYGFTILRAVGTVRAKSGLPSFGGSLVSTSKPAPAISLVSSAV
jgi:hypothetical protein